jgi:hypothetical protein
MHKARFKLLVVALLLAPLPGRAAGRTVAFLEYRAGVRAAARVSAGMAEQLERLTSHAAVSPSEARRRLGPGVDAEVARCQGEASCIARIGSRLGCDEIILVGLSQLGDLILAIQRIDVQNGTVLARLADSLHPRRRIRDETLISYLRRLFPPSDFKRYGQIIVHTSKEGDEVFLNDAFQGKAPIPPLKVSAPARYTVTVKRPGHVPFVARLDVPPDAAVEVTPTLSRKSTPLKWYQHWWVWALAGAVAVGTATAVAVVSLSEEPETVPAVIRLGP